MISKIVRKTAGFGNLAVYTAYAAMWQFGNGLLAPFIIIFMKDLGGSVENLGIAMALLAFTYSVVAYFGGKYSDKFGRKKVLIIFLYLGAAEILAYSFVSSLMQLYVLQIISGATSAVVQTADIALFADITTRRVRGAQTGKIMAAIGMSSAVALLVGGYLVGRFGYDIIFYLVSAVGFIGTTALFLIKEGKRK